ncbi:hypothetical protein QKV95_gp063 [Poseidoniales virus YSH_150918]|uniref:Uncharacterized protein n=1 Tax=Poseidoniales virus YSH_150918 TaxID=3071324 RepID=A0A976UAY2_9CAUD|nr:hypothetical protein QKV95_gp063 [Yangshan Harbor Poseidoniales virus]UVF62537.1 hypothetical protein [Poseidoniales virus YSH_150918]
MDFELMKMLNENEKNQKKILEEIEEMKKDLDWTTNHVVFSNFTDLLFIVCLSWLYYVIFW